MEDPDSNIILPLAVERDRLTANAEGHEVSRSKLPADAQVERVYECQRALDGVPIRVGNLHHANLLLKTSGDRWFFTGYTGSRSGPGSTELLEVKHASEPLDKRTRFFEHNHTTSGTPRRYWVKTQKGQVPGSPTTLGDVVQFCDKMAASKDYHVLKNNCQDGQAALLQYIGRDEPTPSTAESFSPHMAIPVQQAIEASVLGQAQSHQHPPLNLYPTIDNPTARQGDLPYMSDAFPSTQPRVHQPSGFGPSPEHPASGSNHRPPPSASGNDHQPPPNTGGPKPTPNYSSGSIPKEEPRVRVESRPGTGNYLTAAVAGGAAGMGGSAGSAVMFHGAALTFKLGAAISATGSPAVTVGVAATALNPVGAAWMAGVFAVSAGVMLYGMLASPSKD